MAEHTSKTGKGLERQVADAYRAIGAWKVEHDVELAGHQIDVYVEMETADHALHRIAVEVKDYARPVGMNIVADFGGVVDGLWRLKLVDEGVIVSAAGFSRPARNAAKVHGLRLLEAADLKAMAGAPGLGQVCADYLARAVAVCEARMYQHVVSPVAPPDHPYKFLYAFEVEDADIFFGRDTASEDFCQTLLRDRLTVLHAKSGAGKTSLLNAGVSLRLIREGRLPVYARAYHDPIYAIKEVIAPPSLGLWPDSLSSLSLHEFLGLACAHLSRQTQELVVILDQFEEFFIFWPERDHRQLFIDALADCYDDKSLPVRFIIALRKDYYSDLAAFQCRLPHVFHNEYRLDAMTRAEAQSAITGPMAKLGRPVTYEPVLLDTLLDDLARDGMELPHLQIICTQLYEALEADETIITLSSYDEMGRAEGVLGRYLNDVLDKMVGRGEAIAREVLKELVSSEATKRVLSYDALAARVETGEEELDNVLTQLVDARLLRRDETAGEITYEMAHEYLIEEIKQWIDLQDLEFRQAQELLAREVANWRVHGTLIPKDRLELLYVHRERFRWLDDETRECLLRSALQADFAVADYVRLTGEVGEKFFLMVLDDPHGEVRRAATRYLGVIWGLPEVSELGDEDVEQRADAADVLGHLDDPRAVEPLIAALQDEDGDVRYKAAVALGYLGDLRAVSPLLSTLQDEYDNVREAATVALGCLGDANVYEVIEDLMQCLDDPLQYYAFWAMARLDTPRAVDLLVSVLRNEHLEFPEMMVDALVEVGEPAVEPLIAALQDKDNDVYCAVAELLGRIGDPRAVAPLSVALLDEDRKVRWVSAEALEKIGTSEALAALERARR